MHDREKQKRAAAIGVIALLLLLSAILWKYIGTPLIHFISDPAAFRAWVDSHGIYSRIAFVAMVVFQVLIAAIPGEPFEIAAGYAFGTVEGTILSMAGAAIGSLLTFWLVRLLGMKLVRVFFNEKQIDSVKFLKSSPKRDLVFLIIYTIPGTPKDLLGYVAGLTDIRFPVFLLICTLGRFPSIITSTVGGDALGTANYLYAVIVFAVTMLISGLGLLAYNQIRKKQEGGIADRAMDRDTST